MIESIDVKLRTEDRAGLKQKIFTNRAISIATFLRILLYPNPVVKLLHIDFPESVKKAVLSVYDISGCQVLHRQLEPGNPVPTSSLPSGIYLYNLNLDGKNQGGKFVKL